MGHKKDVPESVKMKNIKKTKGFKYTSFNYSGMRNVVIIFSVLVGFLMMSCSVSAEEDIAHASLVPDEGTVDVGDEFYVTLYVDNDFGLSSFVIRELTWENELVELVPDGDGVPGINYNATFPEMWLLTDDGDLSSGKLVYNQAFILPNTEEEKITGYHPFVAFKFRAIASGTVHFVIPDIVEDIGQPGLEVAIADGVLWDNTDVIIQGENGGDPGGDPPGGNGGGDPGNGGGGDDPPPFPPVNVPPVAVLEETYFGNVSEEIIFDGERSYDDGEIVDYIWDTGDDATDLCNCSILTHAYDTAGNYTVMLTVVDNNGSNHSTTALVVISDFEEPEPPEPPDDNTTNNETNGNDSSQGEGEGGFGFIIVCTVFFIIITCVIYFMIIRRW